MHRRTLAGLALGPALAVGLAASPASAQQEGLVNVNITDVTVQVPIGVALNVCDVTVAVLVGTIVDDAAPCDADGGSIAIEQQGGGGGGSPRQTGLINVNLEDVTAQVPIAIAANICNVDVAVLVGDMFDDAATCQAGAMSVA